jgi:hypothetical protein
MGTFKFYRQIMNAKSAINALSDELNPVELANITELTYYIVSSAGVSAGAVQPETAHESGYSGTWSPEGSVVSFTTATTVKHVSITGISNWRRCRISSAIVGGSVSIFAMGR